VGTWWRGGQARTSPDDLDRSNASDDRRGPPRGEGVIGKGVDGYAEALREVARLLDA
jgi:hypothetical protein